jgi:hypothetical protein
MVAGFFTVTAMLLPAFVPAAGAPREVRATIPGLDIPPATALSQPCPLGQPQNFACIGATHPGICLT